MVVVGGFFCCVMVVDRATAVCGTAAAERSRSSAAVWRLFIVVMLMVGYSLH